MLSELRIEGLGAIAAAQVPLSGGFTVLTGETGVGKTMLAVGLRLVGGGRGDAARVRGGAERAVVEGRFVLPSPEVLDDELRDFLDSAGVDLHDEDVLVLRTLGKDGRSKAFIGARAVPLGVLASFAEPLLNVHGQHDQLRLLKAGEQLGALDRFAGEEIAAPLAAWRTAYARFGQLTAELAELRSDEQGRAAEADRLAEGVRRIAEADPKPGEDEALAAEIRRLSDLDDLRERAQSAHVLLTGEDPERADSGAVGAASSLGHVGSLLAGADDDRLRELANRAEEAGTLVAELALDLGAYLGDLPSDSSALEAKLERQAQLKSLIRAYAADVDGVLRWAAEAQERLERIGGGAEAVAKVQAELDAAKAELDRLAGKLTAVRRKAAQGLQNAVNQELSGLSMGGSSLVVGVRAASKYGPNGGDDIGFALKTAGSAEPIPLAKGASGGELSRIMLALELVLAQGREQVTMVFDEVDSGVGGRAAVGIGQRLARLGQHCQVLAVTHLPQVAAYADAHVRIEAAEGNAGSAARTDAAASQVRSLTREERVVELARMLAGMAETETGRAHAEELLATAEADKKRGTARSAS
ncbi:DNA repair protein RecN [Segniliparus rotundus DSM 44985]|uniref:DNA repair protein RecN n=1 Tax=Segniliparus rotundus (strain ATCC BAA-972 / CDC 1076 / CIP 108378 / DSM 44985 / JCM 13578) TaxID=640132 RepID=D6Z7U8_SEGRD|nr:DNA repair protein RecN [Segniliparus rotundus]ADG98028.1 DNA repair protein RecN [Segniliparus rotundus DSM 44985]